jgi:aryl-alcohol dehydrogenase-like predicted oxidoreductase
MDGRADSYGPVDDRESIRAIRRAIDLGITFFDTSDAYGTGHSESVLGRAIDGRRRNLVIATKFGHTHDPARRELTGTDTSARHIREALSASLRRLATDYVDLYQLHLWTIPGEQADEAFGVLEELRTDGLIRAYGWSSGEPDNIRRLAAHPGAAAVQHPLNVLTDAPEQLEIAAHYDLATISNMPLAMGLLTDKFDAGSRLPTDDVRGSGHDWVPYFENGHPKREYLEELAATREILTSGGRTAAQGALAWIWARSNTTIPIPGFKTLRQVEENAQALAFGPLTSSQMADIAEIQSRVSTRR